METGDDDRQRVKNPATWTRNFFFFFFFRRSTPIEATTEDGRRRRTSGSASRGTAGAEVSRSVSSRELYLLLFFLVACVGAIGSGTRNQERWTGLFRTFR